MFRELPPRIFSSRIRFIIPVLTVLSLKVLCSIFLYHRLSILGSFFTPWMEAWGTSGPTHAWLYLFNAQDSGFYVALARVWYAYPMYVFFPAYPVLIIAAGALTGDVWLSAFIISFTLGLATFPLLQSVAEQYMTRPEAAGSTLLAATFPYVFVFTTVSYTESLFLFSTLAAWLLYLKKRLTTSALAATVATLTKTYGVAIVIPIAAGLMAERKVKQLPKLAIPVLSLLGWIYYLYMSTGDPFVFSTQQSYWKAQGVGFGWFQVYLKPLLDFNVWKPAEFNYLLVALIIFFGYMAFTVFSVDSRLGLYSLSVFLPLLYMGNFISLPRFFAFIFPVWLVVKPRNLPALLATVAFFITTSLLVWYQFIIGTWVA
jgi:Gpi18-like mannosyltransferase